MGSEKVEEDIKTAIFYYKKLRFLSQKRRWKETLKLPFLTPKTFDFYLIFISNRILFFVSLSTDKVEEDTKAVIFNSKKDDVIGSFNYYVELAAGVDTHQNGYVPLPMETFNTYVHKEPNGVAALITPCNLLPRTIFIN
ncbi:hypothetical protein AAZX31_15G222000 [Glycine max]